MVLSDFCSTFEDSASNYDINQENKTYKNMKEYIKMTLATITGLFLFGFVAMFLFIGMIGAIAAVGETAPVMPKEAVLSIDFTEMTLAEQTSEAYPLAILQGG